MSKQSVDIEIFKKEYRAYHDAKQRCTNPNHPRYKDWGGRGIVFAFHSFQEFLACVGPVPKGFSIDRIDNDKSYCVGNVRWVDRSTQQHNKRVSKHSPFKVTGVREVKSKGLVTKTFQAYSHEFGKFKQLYVGPSFFEALCARMSYNNKRLLKELNETTKN